MRDEKGCGFPGVQGSAQPRHSFPAFLAQPRHSFPASLARPRHSFPACLQAPWDPTLLPLWLEHALGLPLLARPAATPGHSEEFCLCLVDLVAGLELPVMAAACSVQLWSSPRSQGP